MREVEPTAALTTFPVDVELAAHTYRIDPAPAVTWIDALLTGGWLGIVPGMLTTVDDALDDALDTGVIDYTDVEAAARDAFGAAAGTRWWVALRLVYAGLSNPSAAGELYIAVPDLATVPLARLVQILYRIYTRDMDQKAHNRFDAELNRAPAGVRAEDMIDETAAADAFERMAAARGVT